MSNWTKNKPKSQSQLLEYSFLCSFEPETYNDNLFKFSLLSSRVKSNQFPSRLEFENPHPYFNVIVLQIYLGSNRNICQSLVT